MYLHLGLDVVAETDEIIGIFDFDTSTYSRHTRAFLQQCEKQGRVKSASEDLPRAFVLCKNAGDCRPPLQNGPQIADSPADNTILYISQFSPQTLQKRLTRL